MKRNIIQIDEDRCDGCGLCVDACHEMAIQLVEGKARLVQDAYCDGLGDCLPACPQGAIEIISREAQPFDEVAVKNRMKTANVAPKGCPSLALHLVVPKAQGPSPEEGPQDGGGSCLLSWPIQLQLINPKAKYLQDAQLLIAADCTAFAYGRFHQEFMKGNVTVIGCPKLDDNQFYTDTLTEILKLNKVQSITVIRMSVPCCGGIVQATRTAIARSKTQAPYKEITITVDGQIS